MSFQSDILNSPVLVSQVEELSGMGAAYMAGISTGMYNEELFETIGRTIFMPRMSEAEQKRLYGGWRQAVADVIGS